MDPKRTNDSFLVTVLNTPEEAILLPNLNASCVPDVVPKDNNTISAVSNRSKLLTQLQDLGKDVASTFKDYQSDVELFNLCYESLGDLFPGSDKETIARKAQVWKLLNEARVCNKRTSATMKIENEPESTSTSVDLSNACITSKPLSCKRFKVIFNSPEYTVYQHKDVEVASMQGYISKDLRYKMVRDTVSSMMAYAREDPFNRNPSRHEFEEMAKSMIRVYPLLADASAFPGESYISLFKQLHRRCQNVMDHKKNHGIRKRKYSLEQIDNTVKKEKIEGINEQFLVKERECPEHSEKLTVYCRTDQMLCCPSCETNGAHQGHDCFEVGQHGAEEKQRNIMIKFKAEVDEFWAKQVEVKNEVQEQIKRRKHGLINAKDTIKQYFKELKIAIDQTENQMYEELLKYNINDMQLLRTNLSEVTQLSNKAKSVSRDCEKILNKDYYQMLSQRNKVAEEMEGILNTMATTDISQCTLEQCQFPSHESILKSIRTSGYILRLPHQPRNVSCNKINDESVEIKWEQPVSERFSYPIIKYKICIYSKSDRTLKGIEMTVNTFITLESTFEDSYCEISAINKVGESLPSLEVDIFVTPNVEQ